MTKRRLCAGLLIFLWLDLAFCLWFLFALPFFSAQTNPLPGTSWVYDKMTRSGPNVAPVRKSSQYRFHYSNEITYFYSPQTIFGNDRTEKRGRYSFDPNTGTIEITWREEIGRSAGEEESRQLIEKKVLHYHRLGGSEYIGSHKKAGVIAVTPPMWRMIISLIATVFALCSSIFLIKNMRLKSLCRCSCKAAQLPENALPRRSQAGRSPS